jgi:hypothetical protein
MRFDPSDPDHSPLAFLGGNGVGGSFVSVIAIIVTVALVGVSVRKPWLWALFSP